MEDLFGPNSSDEESVKKNDEQGTNFKDIYEVEKVKLVDIELQIRIFNFHSLNANYVWPGNEPFSQWTIDNIELFKGKRVLELGTGTGVLSIFFKKKGLDIYTSDYDDSQIAENILHNWKLNGYNKEDAPLHVPYNWGEDFPFNKNGVPDNFEIIVCNDCILYVNQYPKLVKTIISLLQNKKGNICYFAPGRRIQKNYENMFFEMLKKEGLVSKHMGKRVYELQF